MEGSTNTNPLTTNEAVKRIGELNRLTGKAWSFKANKGTVKFMCN